VKVSASLAGEVELLGVRASLAGALLSSRIHVDRVRPLNSTHQTRNTTDNPEPFGLCTLYPAKRTLNKTA
jgi:hypothetical protein